MSDRAAPPRTGIWPPPSDALAAASYGAMTAQAVNSPLSGANTARKHGKALADRGRQLASDDREPRASRVGRTVDKAATKAAAVAESPTMHALRMAAESPAAKMISSGLFSLSLFIFASVWTSAK